MKRTVQAAAWGVVLAAGVGGMGVAFGQAGTPPFELPPGEKPGAPGRGPADGPRERGVPGGAARGREADLRPRFTLGDEAVLVMKQKARTSLAPEEGIPGAPGGPGKPGGPKPGGPADQLLPGEAAAGGTSEMEQEITFRTKVVEATPERGATVEMKVERVRMKVDDGVGSIEADTDKPANQPGQPGRKPDAIDADRAAALEKTARAMVGTTMKVTFDRKGRVTAVTGGGSLAGGLLGGTGGVGANEIGPLFGPIGGVDTTPERPRIGERWQHTDTIDVGALGGELRLRTEHTLVAVRGEDAEVKFIGRLDPQSEAPSQGIVKVREVAYAGSYFWDQAAGALKSMKSSQTMVADGPTGRIRSESVTTVERRAGR